MRSWRMPARRGYYERGSEPRRGYRNGTGIGRLKTAEGVVEYETSWGNVNRC